MSILEILQSQYGSIPVTSIDQNLVIDWSKMNDATLAHLIFHGTKQKANDPNGAKALADSEKLGNSQKVLDSLMANEVRMVSGRIADPVEAELMKQARVIVANKLLAKGHKLKDYKMASLNELAEAMLQKYPEVEAKLRANAEKTVADAAAVKSEFSDIEL